MARVAFHTASESFPKQGNRELPFMLDFSSAGTIYEDLFHDLSLSRIESVQSIYIDNSLNAASLIIQFLDTQVTITAQPYSQGIYPVVSAGHIAFKATTAQGIKIPICMSNVAKPFATWGPVPGVLVVPPLTNPAINFNPLAIGDNVLVAGVALTTIKVYRLLFGFGGSANVQFFSGPSAAARPLTGLLPMFAGGGLTMQPSGIAWFTTQPGDNLVLNSDQASQMGGIMGYVQS